MELVLIREFPTDTPYTSGSYGVWRLFPSGNLLNYHGSIDTSYGRDTPPGTGVDYLTWYVWPDGVFNGVSGVSNSYGIIFQKKNSRRTPIIPIEYIIPIQKVM